MREVLFSKYSCERSPAFAVRTSVLRDGGRKWVEKAPVFAEGKAHIENMADACRQLESNYRGTRLRPCPVTVENGIARFPYIEGKSFHERLGELLRGDDRHAVLELCEEFVSLVKGGAPAVGFQKSPGFIRVFGDVDLPEGLTAKSCSNVDLIFENLVEDSDGQVVVFDYEWCFPFQIPLEFILFRAVMLSFWKWGESGLASQFIPLLGIRPSAMPAMGRMLDAFQRYVESGGTNFARSQIGGRDYNLRDVLGLASRMQCCTQIYFDMGNGFCEEDSDCCYHPYHEDFEASFTVKKGVEACRVDPASEFSIVAVKKCCVVTDNGMFDLSFRANGVWMDHVLVFDTADPQLVFDNWPAGVNELRLVLRVDRIGREVAENCRKQQSAAQAERARAAEQLRLQTEEIRMLTESGERDAQELGRIRESLEQAREQAARDLQLAREQAAGDLRLAREQAGKDLRLAREQAERLREELDAARRQAGLAQKRANEERCRMEERLALAREESAENLERLGRELRLLEQRAGEERRRYHGTLERLDAEHHAALSEAERQRQALEQSLMELRQGLSEREALLAGIQQSLSFRMTRPLYRLKTAIYFGMERTPFTRRLRKAVSILRRQGFRQLLLELRTHRERRRLHRSAALEPGAGVLLYDSCYQADCDFSGYCTDIKALAFYLPQFHTFPENDAWWGKGFTEWTNVKKGTPRFAGHYQPRTPHEDIGYYCLEDIDVMRRQAELAKRHGIYGFCFYYYWFSGKRLMEKPVDMLLEHPEIEIPFCLCWANENWTRRWDGQEQDILIRQEYSDADDENFIVDLEKYLRDPRYIRVGGKPVILVYCPCQIPDCRKSFHKWRQKARALGIGEIQIWICLTWGRTAATMGIEDAVDAEVEFPPHNLGGDWLEIQGLNPDGEDVIVYDYEKAVNFLTDMWRREVWGAAPKHYSCMLAWDNAARRKDGWHAFYRFSSDSLYRWVSEAAEQARRRLPAGERFIFINAWNEWGEGSYLEPDAKYGYSNLNTVSKALFGLPHEQGLYIIDEHFPRMDRAAFQKNKKARVAVQAHIFYLEQVDELAACLNAVPYPYDLYVTTDTEQKKKLLLSSLRKNCPARGFQVLVLPNRGRDVAPFLTQIAPVISQYDYVGHIHTKKTVTAGYGDAWRQFLFQNLFGSAAYLERLFRLFEENPGLGLLMPEMFPEIREQAAWTGENEGVTQLLRRMGCQIPVLEPLAFPAGNMFWARTAAVRPLFELGLRQEDFPEEAGQRYSTLAHQIERAWPYIAMFTGYQPCTIRNVCN